MVKRTVTKPDPDGAKGELRDLDRALLGMFEALDIPADQAAEGLATAKVDRPIKPKSGDGYSGPPPGPVRAR